MTGVDLLLFLISLVAGYLLLVGIASAVLPVTRLASEAGELFMRPFTATADKAEASSRFRVIEDEINRELGRLDPMGRQARADVVSAALQTQRIRVLDQKFRQAVTSCVRTHWAVAEGLGATHMSEAARHPMCGQLRERVIDLSELLSQSIETYPLLVDSPELVRLHVGLHRIAPTCITCPYWTTTPSEAPKLCPPAHAVGCRPNHSPQGGIVIDAQIVEGDS